MHMNTKIENDQLLRCVHKNALPIPKGTGRALNVKYAFYQNLTLSAM